MSKPYVVTHASLGIEETWEFETFDEALEAYDALPARPRWIAGIHNQDRCDYCSIEGWDDGLTDDGLTDDEREEMS